LVCLEEHRLFEGVEEILIGFRVRDGAPQIFRIAPHQELLLAFKSKPRKPHPLFAAFIGASLKAKHQKRKNGKKKKGPVASDR